MSRPVRPSRSTLPAPIVLLLAAVPASAQTGHLSFDLGVAHALPPADAPGEAATYLLGGARLQPAMPEAISLFVSLHGGYSLPRESGDWGAAELGLGARGPIGGGRSAGILTRTEAFTVGGEIPYRALALRATPELRQAFGRTLLRLHATGGVGGSRVGPVAEGLEAATTELWMAGGGLELIRSGRAATLTVGGEAFRAAREAEYLSAYAVLSVELGGVAWRAEIRGWNAPDGDELVATALVAIPLGPSLEGQAAGGRYGPDPLLESPAGTAVSTVLSWRARRFSTPREVPYSPLPGGGAVRFRIERPGAREVRVAGEFSSWEPLPMTEEPPGEWTAVVVVPPGVYRFGFLVDGRWWVPPGLPGTAEDEWGRPSAVLLVPEP